jgi:hydroxyacylglutathione hydrolase
LTGKFWHFTLGIMATVLHVCAFEDNYIWLAAGVAGRVVIVDPGDAAPVLAGLQSMNLTPVAILCTHHHGDHVGGIEGILRYHDIPVYGPAGESIPRVAHRLRGGDRLRLAETVLEFDVIDVPGHTAGHIAYFGHGLLFCGDTLFSAGCGRLFEGTAEQLHRSLARLAALPDDTAVYCAHEYTATGLRFSATVEPENTDVKARGDWASKQLARNAPTLPSTIGVEKRINMFLRASVPAVRRAVETHCGRSLTTEVSVFAELRRWRDGFRG